MADEKFEPKVYRVLSDLFTGQGDFRVETETTLPDYKEAAERIVRVQARARVTDKTLTMHSSDAVCEVEGIVSFHILYMAQEGQGNAPICAWQVQEAFSQSVKIPLSDGAIDPDEICIQVDLQTENIICKLLGPRKISLRCEVKHHLNVKGNRDLLAYDSFPCQEIHLKSVRQNATKLVQVHSEKIDLTESITLPGAYPAISEMMQMDMDLFCRRARASEGGIRFSGIADLRCSYLSQGDNELISFYQPVEFEKNVGIPLCTEDSICRVVLSPSYLRATPDVNSDGEMKEIRFEIGCTAEVFVFEAFSIQAAEDVFSTKNRILSEKREQNCREILKTMDFCVSQRVTVPQSEKEFVRAEDVGAVSCFHHSYLEGQNIVLEGKADFSYLGYTAQDTVESGHLSHDFKVNVPLDSGWEISDGEDCRIEITGICRGADLSPVGNQTEIRYEICGTICIFAHHTVACLTSVETAEEHAPHDRGLIFYYPEKGEDLWQVCKKFHVAPEAVLKKEEEKDNDFSVVRILR